MRKLTLVLLIFIFIYGCRRGPSDEQLIQTTIDNWKHAMMEQDLDTIMANYSEEFTSGRVNNKEEMREFMQRAIEDGWLDYIDINTEIAQLTITDGTADYSPVEIAGDFEPMVFEMTLKKEGKRNWRIIKSAPQR